MTMLERKYLIKEAAIIAVKRIGINQVKDIPEEIFVDLPQYYNMFKTRLNILQNV